MLQTVFGYWSLNAEARRTQSPRLRSSLRSLRLCVLIYFHLCLMLRLESHHYASSLLVSGEVVLHLVEKRFLFGTDIGLFEFGQLSKQLVFFFCELRRNRDFDLHMQVAG